MKSKTKTIILETICLLFVVLFVYAAVSKLMDYFNFEAQLSQSPIFGDFSGFVAWSLPTLEIIISFLLVIPKYRLLGLYASLSIMILFTIYLFIILNFFELKDIPYSCGGILNNLGWSAHIYFNLFVIILAIIGIKISSYPIKNKLYLVR